MKAKILVVEDEGILAMGLKRKLETLGYEITGLASTGQEAIEMASSNKPDLVLMDIVLRGNMDGIETAKELIRRYNTALIYITAYSDDDILKRVMLTEPYAYIVKPLRESELKANIDIALFKHSQGAERNELVKKKLLADYYGFILDSIDKSLTPTILETKQMLLKTFEESFEDDMKPRFEKALQDLQIDFSSVEVDELFNSYVSWLSQLFEGLGIMNTKFFTDEGASLEFLNCPWISCSSRNPIFCMNCEAMIRRSFRWTELKGKIEDTATIANNAPRCSFKLTLENVEIDPS
jgi:CheY-like chemotaxis protein